MKNNFISWLRIQKPRNGELIGWWIEVSDLNRIFRQPSREDFDRNTIKDR